MLHGQTQTVRVWQDELPLRTQLDLPTDELPPFDQFAVKGTGNYFIYPYPARDNISNERATVPWRALHLENEYLHCRILPDLGGHLYSCRDKVAGVEMFYDNHSIRKFETGPRGAWASLGVETSFPIAHSRLSISPVQFATARGADGSATAVVAARDRVSGMEWRVAYTLRPGRAVLEQKVTLSNPGSVRQPYQWWTNAAVRLPEGGLELVYPMYVTAPHGTGGLDTWPVNRAGVNQSRTGTHKDAIGVFAYESNEPFFAAYDRKARTGVVHWADPKEVPGKKLWAWGEGPGSYNYQDRLSDDHSGYVEIQAGLLTTQGMMSFLGPRQSRSFTELWIPARDVGGITRATADLILFLSRKAQNGGEVRLAIDLDATGALPGAAIRVMQGGTPVFQENADLAPATTYHRETPPLPAAPQYRLEVLDASGKVLLAHVENTYDAVKASQVKIGEPFPPPRPKGSAEENALASGEDQELLRFLDSAAGVYRSALEKAPQSTALRRAAGRLALSFGRFEEAVQLLSGNTSDTESLYELGVARSRMGNDTAARPLWEAAANDRRFGGAARFELACAAARRGDRTEAVRLLRQLPEDAPADAAGLEIALLRRLGDTAGAARALDAALAANPTDSLVRVEASLLGREDAAIWPLLGQDAEWILDVADRYFSIGLFDDAAALLAHAYPAAPDFAREPGEPAPQDDPLVAYYRGYARLKAGQAPDADFTAASALSTRYVFPYRVSSWAVLRAAIERNPQDATAHYLLGCLMLHSRMTSDALREWALAKPAARKIPAYYETVARTLYSLTNNQPAAESLLEEAIAADPSNSFLKRLLDGIRSNAPGTQPAPIILSSFENSPDAARYALETAAKGNADAAMGVFVARNFRAERQPPEVRQAYIEVQLRQLVTLAGMGKCDDAAALSPRFGAENPTLPFTFSSFGAFIKPLRVQYYVALVESLCGNPKAAAKTWGKIAKSAVPLDSPDYAFPALAAATLNPAQAARTVEVALEKLRTEGGSLEKGLQLYSEGMLLRAAGKLDDAGRRFADGYSNSTGFLRFWNGAALHDPPPPK